MRLIVYLTLHCGVHYYGLWTGRPTLLQPSDISSTLERFDQIRKEYASGNRVGGHRFAVVSNVGPSPSLDKYASGGEWPTVVSLIWPEAPNTNSDFLDRGLELPRAFASVADAFAWCSERAKEVPFTRLLPDSLVWKLAAIVQYVCTGPSDYPDHEISIDALPSLLDQVVAQLHQLPDAPSPYRSHINEPDLSSTDPVRVITGLSGSGKTTWAAQVAAHCEQPVAYFDIGDTGDATVGSSLVRDLAAAWIPSDDDTLGAVLLPGATGLEGLRAINLYIQRTGTNPLVIIDNVHRVDPIALRDAIAAVDSAQFVLLAQQWPGLPKLEALTDGRTNALNGWSIETIANYFSDLGMSVTPETSQRLRDLTGGLPLFVTSAARSAKGPFGGDVGELCTAWENATQPEVSRQQAILERVFEQLSDTAKDAIAALGLCTVPLSTDELYDFLNPCLELESAQTAAAILHATRWGSIESLASGSIVLHDSFRPLAAERRVSGGAEFVDNVATSLRQVLLATPSGSRSSGRLRLTTHLLAILGDMDALADLYGDEFFYEYGFKHEFSDLLERYASDPSSSPEKKFWALDGLAFSDLSDEDPDAAWPRIEKMEELVSELDETVRGRVRLLTKHLLYAGLRRNRAGSVRIFKQAMRECQPGEPAHLVIRDNYGVALIRCGQPHLAKRIASELIEDLYAEVGLDPAQVFATNTPEVAAALGDNVHKIDELNHLADSLDLYANARFAQGLTSGMARMHAMKFYDSSHALTSLVKVGQSVVDEMPGILRDPGDAREFIESTLIPLIEQNRILSYIVPVRAQYAVVLAYCGEHELARKELSRLEGFRDSLQETQRLEFEKQTELVESIAEGTIRLLGPPVPHVSLPGT